MHTAYIEVGADKFSAQPTSQKLIKLQNRIMFGRDKHTHKHTHKMLLKKNLGLTHFSNFGQI